jgi:hypothetical protein
MTEALQYAWCFSHGALHCFMGAPWCTATWVPLPASNEIEARAAKSRLYGLAQFLHDLPWEQQVDIIQASKGEGSAC